MEERNETGLTPGQIAVSLGYRAAYFRSAEGGWRDDTADLLEAAAACIADLWNERNANHAVIAEAAAFYALGGTYPINGEMSQRLSALLLANTGGTENG